MQSTCTTRKIKQHKYIIRREQLMSNSLFLHRNNFNHAIDWDNSKVLLNLIVSQIFKLVSV